MRRDEQDESAFLQHAKATLDRGDEELDPVVTTRLRQARRDALRGRARRPAWVLPTGALAAAASLVIGVGVWLHQPAPRGAAPLLDDVELLSTSEDLEFYENLEFFYWLANEHEAG